MKPFKFLRSPIIKAHDGGDIYVDQVFYTMNKEDIVNPINGKITFKYTIVQRMILPEFQYKFKPDHNALWYFKTKQNAEYLKTIWERQDGGEIFFRQSDIRITFGPGSGERN